MPDKVAEWLRQLGLERYGPVFAKNDVDAEVLPELTDADLRELGVSLGHRKKILKFFAALRAGGPPARADGRSGSAQAERRQLTIMFCDLVGSTLISEKLDPEELSELNLSYQDAWKRAIERYDGYVAQHLGDGLLAYFGYPQAHEDDAERAVRAGLDVVKATVDLDARLDLEDIDLSVRVGIETGRVVVGDLSREGFSLESAVIGETPNLAARVQSLAPPNSVVTGPVTHQLTADVFACETLGEHELKGLSALVPVWRVLAPHSLGRRFEEHPDDEAFRLIGRDADLDLLRDRWQKAKGGHGRTVVLCGEAGVGKTQLLRTLRRWAAFDEPVRVHFQCSSYHRDSAYHPFAEQLQWAAGIEDGETSSSKLDKLDALLASSSASAGTGNAVLADLLSIPSDGRYPETDLTPDARKAATQAAILSHLLGLAQQGPVLLSFEDAHWCDASSLELLVQLIDRSSDQRLMAVVTHRPEFDPPWSRQDHISTLNLYRLDRRQTIQLIERTLQGKTLPGTVLDEIIDRSDGIPLYVQELTKGVLDSGQLAEVGGRFVIKGKAGQVYIPTSLQDSLMARLDRLGRAKEAAQLASALGRRFSFTLLLAIAPMNAGDLENALSRLVDSELMIQRGVGQEATYTFNHVLVQEAAHRSLLRSKRRLLHSRIAEVLQTQFPNIDLSQPEILAQHYAEADCANHAIECYRRAAEKAAARSAYSEALNHLDAALDLLDRGSEDSDSQRRELELLTALRNILVVTKGYSAPEVEKACIRSRELCGALGDTRELFQVLWNLAGFAMERSEHRRSHEYNEELLRIAQESNEDDLLLMAHDTVGQTFHYLGDFVEAQHHFDQAIALYRPEEHHQLSLTFAEEDPGVAASAYSAVNLWILGQPARAQQAAEHALALAEELPYPLSMALALVNATQLNQLLRDHEAVARQAEALILLSEDKQIEHYRPYGVALQGWSVLAGGEARDGLVLIRQGIDCWAGPDDGINGYYHCLLVEAQLRNGGHDEALEILTGLEARIEESEERLFLAEVHRWKGETELARAGGDPAVAEAHFRTAIEVAERQGASSLALRSATSLARALARLERKEEVRLLLTPVLERFAGTAETPDLRDARAILNG